MAFLIKIFLILDSNTQLSKLQKPLWICLYWIEILYNIIIFILLLKIKNVIFLCHNSGIMEPHFIGQKVLWSAYYYIVLRNNIIFLNSWKIEFLSFFIKIFIQWDRHPGWNEKFFIMKFYILAIIYNYKIE